LKLIGSITNGSGQHNEDGFGFVEQGGAITAAWVFDGVTGINAASVLDVPSEPAWFVEKAQKHLRDVVEGPGDVVEVLRALVSRLEEEWAMAVQDRNVPVGFDLPAACLTLVKWVDGRWQALRLGDSYVLSNAGALMNHPFPPSDLTDLESELKIATTARRSAGMFDMKTLRDEFRPRLLANRRNRNAPGSYSILVPDQTSLNMPQVIEIGRPSEMLLCTDGFYRAVDIYGLLDDVELMTACTRVGGVDAVLAAIRKTEAEDPTCEQYIRFKPADDATAVCLLGSP
jgi:Protein phosphatase 2C